MIKSIKGTNDILPDEIKKWEYLLNIVKNEMEVFNYKEIRTPVFEHTELFARGIGNETDIVSKEMYSFTDKSENNITLRPEMTASVVRAFIEHSLGKQAGLHKLFYISPMFRQERPQAGRLRQFHQFGIEAIGSNNPSLDAEIIQVAYNILKKTGLKNLTVLINSLGTSEERTAYTNALKEFIKPKLNQLSEESQRRFETNVLRILDSKDKNDQQIVDNAPSILEFLKTESNQHFEKVKTLLNVADIPFEVSPKLVRGLDYYTHTTFEILSTSVGSQSALCGGGRYNPLIEWLGGPSIPAVGFAAGIERILLACKTEEAFQVKDDEIDIYIVDITKEENEKVFEFASNLRNKNFKVEFDYLSRSVKAQMREANKLNAKYVIFVGGDELIKNQVQVKDMNSGDQENIEIEELTNYFSK
ncbi:MAG: histidine--tRNA ligase [Ignavibacteriae bacterium]|nr:MAG: histidine--tRNA ligase [Ignavibacteriota bacterium]